MSVLRKLKFILNRNSLAKIYLTFIRPVMEYGCEVWNGCGVNLTDQLEKLQLEAARIVTGLPAYASRDSLYVETGWEKLIERRNRKCLCLMYNIINNTAPSYLSDILPPKISEITHYPLRNNDNYVIPHYRLTRTLSSFFFPSTLRAWNSCSLEQRQIDTSGNFKRQLINKNVCPLWYSFGQRKFNIIHTKIRYNNSTLNYDLYRCNLRDNPGCLCGFNYENAYHFFLECPFYNNIRRYLFLVLRIYGDIDLNVIIYGNENLSLVQNIDICTAVHNFIRDSHRFD